MRKNSTVIIPLILISFVLFSSCKNVFQANFESDTEGSPPSVSPPGSPSNDAINFSAGNCKVVLSALLSSKALQFERGGTSVMPYLEFVTGAQPHSTTSYSITFKAYTNTAQPIPAIAMEVQSGSGARALELSLFSGKIHLISGKGDEIVGAYQVNEVHNVLLLINTADSEFNVLITQPGSDSITLSNVPFIDNTFSEIHKIRFEYPPVILEAFNGKYVIDDVVIAKKK